MAASPLACASWTWVRGAHRTGSSAQVPDVRRPSARSPLTRTCLRASTITHAGGTGRACAGPGPRSIPAYAGLTIRPAEDWEHNPLRKLGL